MRAPVAKEQNDRDEEHDEHLPEVKQVHPPLLALVRCLPEPLSVVSVDLHVLQSFRAMAANASAMRPTNASKSACIQSGGCHVGAGGAVDAAGRSA